LFARYSPQSVSSSVPRLSSKFLPIYDTFPLGNLKAIPLFSVKKQPYFSQIHMAVLQILFYYSVQAKSSDNRPAELPTRIKIISGCKHKAFDFSMEHSDAKFAGLCSALCITTGKDDATHES
jgi:hypothetical protein